MDLKQILREILEENIIRYRTKNLSEEQKQKLLEQEVDPDEPGVVTKSGGFGMIGKPRRNKMRGIQRGGFMGGVSYELTRERNVDLKTVNDVLAKINKDLSDNASWAKIPQETRNMLADGFYNALTTILDREPIKNLERKAGRDLKKFFKKSQRWKFVALDLPDFDHAYKIESDQKMTDQQLQEAVNAIQEGVNYINTGNCDVNTILGKEAAVIRVWENDMQTLPVQKKPLATMLPYVDKEFKQVKTADAVEKTYIQPVEFKTPRNTKVFPVGSFLVTSEAANMVNSIIKQIMNAQFTVNINLPNGKTKTVTDSGGEIIKQGGKFNVDYLNVISSASNYWGKKVDFSHDNAGNEVKDFASVDNSGASGKNKKLAEKRNKALTDAILAELKQVPWLEVNLEDGYSIRKEIRVTDTEGKTDEMPKDDPSKYKNPGQYAEFETRVSGRIDYEYKKSEKYAQKGSFKALNVTLVYVGRKKTEFTIDASLVFGGVTKAAIVKARPIKTMFMNLGLALQGNEGGLKHNPSALRTGSDAWQTMRQNMWQKSIGNK